MVNSPNPTPPPGQGSNAPAGPEKNEAPPKNTGSFQFSEPHTFLGMTFTAKDWNKLMNIFLKNLNDYINKSFQKATEKMKKDWKRGSGEDVD